MLQQEFEALIGAKVDENEFNTVINPMYMSTDMDKQDFAKDFKKHGLGSSTVAKEMSDRVNEQRMAIHKMKEEISNMIDFLISMRNERCDQKAIRKVGHREVIRRKIEFCIELTDDDKQFIAEEFRS